jgi:hypothetical protein
MFNVVHLVQHRPIVHIFALSPETMALRMSSFILLLLPAMSFGAPSHTYCSSFAGTDQCPFCVNNSPCAVSLSRKRYRRYPLGLREEIHDGEVTFDEKHSKVHVITTRCLCMQNQINPVDSFWTDPRYCVLAQSNSPNVTTGKMPPSSICQDYDQSGWYKGILSMDIWDLPGNPGPPAPVGKAYVFITYDYIMYITLTFKCNYLFSTAATPGLDYVVQIGLWTDQNQPAQ